MEEEDILEDSDRHGLAACKEQRSENSHSVVYLVCRCQRGTNGHAESDHTRPEEHRSTTPERADRHPDKSTNASGGS